MVFMDQLLCVSKVLLVIFASGCRLTDALHIVFLIIYCLETASIYTQFWRTKNLAVWFLSRISCFDQQAFCLFLLFIWILTLCKLHRITDVNLVVFKVILVLRKSKSLKSIFLCIFTLKSTGPTKQRISSPLIISVLSYFLNFALK